MGAFGLGTVAGVVDEGSGETRSGVGRRPGGGSGGDRHPGGGASTTWTINWGGAIGVLVAFVVVLAVWQRLENPDSDAATETRPTTAATEVTSPPTTVASTTTTSTTTAPTTTTVDPRRVLLSGEVKPCRFGRECLVAHLTIEGFDPHPGSYACIYSNSLSGFEFADDQVDDACLTGDTDDTITVEVDGVRSNTISEDDLGDA